jgi:carboxymethylenebutenolidase
MGEMVSFASNGGQAQGYLSRPASGGGPGVIVIQEWWGLVPHIREVADRFADEGYVALAPDLYRGKSTKEPDEAQKMAMAMKMDEAARDMSGAFEHLKLLTSNSKVGCVGYCMGGGLSLYLATLRPVDACVIYYGVVMGAQPDISRLAGPVLGHYASADTWISADAVHSLERQIHDAGQHAEMYLYEGADHGFYNDTRPEVYNKGAAELSWDRTIAFFDAHLKK